MKIKTNRTKVTDLLENIFMNFSASAAFKKKTKKGFALVLTDYEKFTDIKALLKNIKKEYEDLSLNFSYIDYSAAEKVKISIITTKILKQLNGGQEGLDDLAKLAFPFLDDVAESLSIKTSELYKIYQFKYEHRLNFSIQENSIFRVDRYNVGTFKVFYCPNLNEVRETESKQIRIDSRLSKNEFDHVFTPDNKVYLILNKEYRDLILMYHF